MEEISPNQMLRQFVFWLFGLAFLLLPLKTVLAQDSDLIQATIPAQTLSDLRQLAQLRSANNQSVSIRVPSPSGDVAFSLSPTEIRAPGFRAEADDGTTRTSVTSRIALFAAHNSENKNFLRLSLVTDKASNHETLKGLMRKDDTFYTVSTTPGTSLGLDVRTVTEASIKGILAQCGTVDVPHENSLLGLPSAVRDFKSVAGASQKAPRVVEVATEADFQHYLMFGSTDGTLNNIITILNQVDGIYQSQLNLRISLVYSHIHTSIASQPYSTSTPDAGTLLDQLQTYWGNNFSSVPADTVHFFTGILPTGPVVGVSYISGACSSLYQYGLSTVAAPVGANQAVLTAHELGHMLGANHDTCSGSLTEYVMCPYVTSSHEFSPDSKVSIDNFLNSGGSCITVGASQPPPSNAPPTFDALGNQTVAEGGTLNFNVRAVDPEGQSVNLTYSPNLAGFSFNGTTATYSPNFSVVSGGASTANQVVNFVATDPQGASSTMAVTITVANTNRPPSLAAIGNKTTSEGQKLTFSLSATDPDSEPLTFSATNLPYGAYLNRSSGSFRWTPRWNQSGTYTISFSVKDPFGASSSRSMTITVADALSSPPPSSLNLLTVFRSTGGMWFNTAGLQRQHGLPGDVAMIADYDGDGSPNLIVWRPLSGMWFADNGEQEQFGLYGDLPSTGDFDRDGIADLVVYRQTTGKFYVRLSATQTTYVVTLGLPGDIPLVCDYDGDGRTDAGLYRPSTATWYVFNSSNVTVTSAQFGRPQDIPIPGPYTTSSRCNLAVWEADTATFNILELGRVQHGAPGDIPTPADITGDGKLDLLTYRSPEGNWQVRNSDGSTSVVQLGLDSDVPAYASPLLYALRHRNEVNPGALLAPASASFYDRTNKTLYSASLLGVRSRSLSAAVGSYIFRADRDGEGTDDLGTYLNGLWTYVLSSNVVQTAPWGRAGDIPMVFDGDGDKKADLTVYRPSEGAWYVVQSMTGLGRVYSWGRSGDLPVSNVDWNGDGISDPTVFRNGLWYILDGRSGVSFYTIQYGLPGDIPLAGDFDFDGRSDLVVFRNGFWFILFSGGGTASFQYGLPGDVPMLFDFFGESRPSVAVFRPSNQVLYTKSLGGPQRSVQLPRRTAPRRGRTQAINLQVVNLESPLPVR